VPAIASVHGVDRETSSDGCGLGEYVFSKRHGAGELARSGCGFTHF
jgi:hypothetical protein